MTTEGSSLTERFRSWMERHDDPADPATPAATVLVLRDSDDGPEVLMVKRNSKGSFASNWVFPGGKVDPEDFAGDDDLEAASRRAAAREAAEEADVVIDPGTLVPFSHWMPPTVVPRRFSTWFYAAEVPPGDDGDVNIDGGEIVDHVWVTPDEALARHAAGDVELVPPTWVTLRHLCGHDDAGDLLARIAAREPRFYVTQRISADPMTVAWHGDEDYAADPTPGGRHRLIMQPGEWSFEEPPLA